MSEAPSNSPTGRDQGCFLGAPLDSARESNFFSFFCLVETGSETKGANRRVITFKPEGPAFRDLVTVNVTLEGRARIAAMELLLRRSFIDDRNNGMFARDIAKSLLRSALPQSAQSALGDLINEIEYHFVNERSVIIAERPLPDLPHVPSDGYSVYLEERVLFRMSTDFAQPVRGSKWMR